MIELVGDAGWSGESGDDWYNIGLWRERERELKFVHNDISNLLFIKACGNICDADKGTQFNYSNQGLMVVLNLLRN